MRAAVVGALQHQQFPFPVLVERLAHYRDSSRPAIFSTLFSFINRSGALTGLRACYHIIKKLFLRTEISTTLNA